MGPGARGFHRPAARDARHPPADVIGEAPGSDWLEFSLDVEWTDEGRLAVETTVDVACWCETDHTAHHVDHLRVVVEGGISLAEAFRAGGRAHDRTAHGSPRRRPLARPGGPSGSAGAPAMCHAVAVCPAPRTVVRRGSHFIGWFSCVDFRPGYGSADATPTGKGRAG